MPPKILVGCPTAGPYLYCLSDYATSVKQLTYPSYDILLADNSASDYYLKEIEKAGISAIKGPYLPDLRDRVAASRNLLRQKAIEEGYDYFLSLEQDIIPPPDVLERLLRHQQPVVSGVYYKVLHVTYTHKGKPLKTTKKIIPVVWRTLPGTGNTEKLHFCTTQDVEGNKFFKIRAAGLGCLLIHRSILEKIPFRIAEDKQADKGNFDDVNFSNDLHNLGIPMYVDTSVKCKHLETKKDRSPFYQR